MNFVELSKHGVISDAGVGGVSSLTTFSPSSEEATTTCAKPFGVGHFSSTPVALSSTRPCPFVHNAYPARAISTTRPNHKLSCSTEVLKPKPNVHTTSGSLTRRPLAFGILFKTKQQYMMSHLLRSRWNPTIHNSKFPCSCVQLGVLGVICKTSLRIWG